MAEKMNVVPVNNGNQGFTAWEHEISLIAPGNSAWVLIPDQINRIDVTLSFTGGSSGKMQTTTEKIDTIKNGLPIAIDWPFGSIDVSRSESCKPVSAIRAVQEAAGTMKVTIRAQ